MAMQVAFALRFEKINRESSENLELTRSGKDRWDERIRADTA